MDKPFAAPPTARLVSLKIVVSPVRFPALAIPPNSRSGLKSRSGPGSGAWAGVTLWVTGEEPRRVLFGYRQALFAEA
jgi:hypothetical protein